MITTITTLQQQQTRLTSDVAFLLHRTHGQGFWHVLLPIASWGAYHRCSCELFALSLPLLDFMRPLDSCLLADLREQIKIFNRPIHTSNFDGGAPIQRNRAPCYFWQCTYLSNGTVHLATSVLAAKLSNLTEMCQFFPVNVGVLLSFFCNEGWPIVPLIAKPNY